ncbi:MAG: DUF488 domain-containing protein [Chloroflexota bacterium]
MNKIVTIGVIGYTAEAFFRALQNTGVDTLVDIRQRRAVRGSDYAFANSQRLQARLADLGIRYLHALQLAPTESVRAQQAAADKASQTASRKRTDLSPEFIEAFQREVLDLFEPQPLDEALPDDAQVVALLCVEREPAACHRSLVAARLQEEWGVEVVHLTPR